VKNLHFLRSAAIVLTILFLGSPARAQFNFVETENLRLVYYGKAHSFLVSHTARCFENSLRFHRNLFDYTPSEKITVLLHDLSDFGNGGAGTSPRNRISLGIAPLSYEYETTPANERINATMNHELAHIVAADKANAYDNIYRKCFGGKVPVSSEHPLTVLYNYLTLPRRSAPLWYHEGIAVFMETWMAGGLGRALGAYDEMVFRTMVRDSSRFYLIQGLESEGTQVDFLVGVNSYLYGTRFFSYLALRYGSEKLIEWVSRTNGSHGYYAAQFKAVYQTTLDQTWRDWIEWEKEHQNSNLKTVREYPVSAFRPITNQPLGSVSRGFYDSASRRLYCAINRPGEVAYIAAIDVTTGEIHKLREIKGAAIFFVTSVAFDSSSQMLFSTTDNNGWRDLESLNIATGESRMLMKDARVGDLVLNQVDSSIWGVRHFNGISALVRIPRPYSEWNLVYAFPYGKDIYDINISPDGGLLVGSLSEISGRQTLISMDTKELLQGDTAYQILHDFKNTIPENFTFSPDGRCLYGSSYYTGVSNIFRYNIEADSMDVLSNCETGLFRPIFISDDSLVAFLYREGGFQPVMIPNRPLADVNATTYLGQMVVKKYPILESWNVGSPAQINLDSLVLDSGRYHEWSYMGLSSGYPIIEGYKDFAAAGAQLNFSGPLELDAIGLTFSYSPHEALPADERIHLKAVYRHVNWSLSANHNAADFYDLFGPTKTSRKGSSVGWNWQKSLLYDPPRAVSLGANISYYGGLEKLPEYQNVITSYDRFLAVGLNLGYQNQVASLGAVDYEKGISWQLRLTDKYVEKKHFPRFVANLDFGAPLHMHHSSLWLRSSAGYSPGDFIQPLANFYFGGFGNNWVDHRAVKNYRRYDAMPGAGINEIAGTSFLKSMLELNLPPLRFRQFGIPSLYASWARLAIFTSALRTNVNSNELGRSVYDVGGQLDLRIMLLSHLEFTLSCGYAAWFEHGAYQSDEFMVSLKVL
jgi:hypothetical protein